MPQPGLTRLTGTALAFTAAVGCATEPGPLRSRSAEDLTAHAGARAIVLPADVYLTAERDRDGRLPSATALSVGLARSLTYQTAAEMRRRGWQARTADETTWPLAPQTTHFVMQTLTGVAADGVMGRPIVDELVIDPAPLAPLLHQGHETTVVVSSTAHWGDDGPSNAEKAVTTAVIVLGVVLVVALVVAAARDGGGGNPLAGLGRSAGHAVQGTARAIGGAARVTARAVGRITPDMIDFSADVVQTTGSRPSCDAAPTHERDEAAPLPPVDAAPPLVDQTPAPDRPRLRRPGVDVGVTLVSNADGRVLWTARQHIDGQPSPKLLNERVRALVRRLPEPRPRASSSAR